MPKAPAHEQLGLFLEFHPEDPSQSHTFELFDAIPKYVFDKKSKMVPTGLSVTKEFQHRGVTYRVRANPAAIMQGKREVFIFPGEREELVVRAILFMAAQEHIALSTKQKKQDTLISATFSLYQLRLHLQEMGHGFKLAELNEAVRVCEGAAIELYAEGNGEQAMMRSGIFMSYHGKDLIADKTGSKSMRHIFFNQILNTSIFENTTWPINYKMQMALSSPLARWIYDRISHNFRQAEKGAAIKGTGYTLSLQAVLAGSGMKAGTRLNTNILAVRAALDELQEEGVLEKMRPYDEKPTLGEKPKRGFTPVVDMVWILYPSSVVVEDIIKGNTRKKRRAI